MKERIKQISRYALAIVLLIGGWYGIFLIYHPEGENHEYSILGVLLGLIIIGFYQERYANEFTYRFRYILNAISIGLGFLILSLPGLIIHHLFSRPVFYLFLEFFFGLVFGGIISYFQYYGVRRQSRLLKYTGPDSPIVSGSARVLNFGSSSSGPGRAILLRDKILFLSKNSDNREVFTKDIKKIEIGRLLGFPNRLIFLFGEAETITFSLPMPYYWKKKIESLEKKDQ